MAWWHNFIWRSGVGVQIVAIYGFVEQYLLKVVYHGYILFEKIGRSHL